MNLSRCSDRRLPHKCNVLVINSFEIGPTLTSFCIYMTINGIKVDIMLCLKSDMGF